jgi:Holliday junction resolvasome RuvABC endonuclease subunit
MGAANARVSYTTQCFWLSAEIKVISAFLGVISPDASPRTLQVQPYRACSQKRAITGLGNAALHRRAVEVATDISS